MNWRDWLAEQAAAREEAGLTRRLRPRSADDRTIDLAGKAGLLREGDALSLATAAAMRRACGLDADTGKDEPR